MKKKPVSKEESSAGNCCGRPWIMYCPAARRRRLSPTLLGRFGGFSGVFLAPQEELAAVLGQPPARFLRLVTDLARAYLEDSSQDLARVYDADSAIALFRPKFLGRSTEAVCLMLLDSRGRLLYNDFITEGAVSAVPIYIRPLLQLCIATTPSTCCWPTTTPAATRRPPAMTSPPPARWKWPWRALRPPKRPHHFRRGGHPLLCQCGWLGQIKEEVRDYRREELQAAREQEAAILWGDSLL